MSTTAETPQVLPHAYPLDDFYAQQGLKLPPIAVISSDDVPQPYHSLLVHDGDMTPPLEYFHGGRLQLTVLRRQQRGEYCFREIILTRECDDAPVLFGATKISLDYFPTLARQDLLLERSPLGRILVDHRVRYTSNPKAYLRVDPDDFIRQALKVTGESTLYGRRNTLWDPDLMPLAEMVEILPPEPRN